MNWFKPSRPPKSHGAAHRVGQRRLRSLEQLETRIALSVSPVSAEFQVNTETAGAQQTSNQMPNAVAMDADGDYVVTWMSNGQDGSGFGIYAQRYSAAGFRQGDEFRVNASTAGHQQMSSVAMDDDGNFVVVWTSAAPDDAGVYFRRYNAAGAAQGGEVRIANSIAISRAAVAMNSAGEFVVSWSASGESIRAQRFGADGTAQGNQVVADSVEASTPRVAMNDNGDFVLIWTVEVDGDHFDIYGRLYDENSNPQGQAFRITDGERQWQPTVAMDDNGGFVVAWSNRGEDANDDSWGIYARRFDANGQRLGSEILVNTTTANHQIAPTIAMAPSGEFVITWTSAGQDSANTNGIYAQRFLADGTRDGGEFRINTRTAGHQEWSSIAMDDTGDFVVVWTSASQDGSGNGVFGQRFGNDDPGENVAPELTGRVGNPRTTVGEELSYRFSAGAFTDGNMGDVLTYSATLVDGTPLPDWLNFDPATRVFSGTPDSDDAGQYAIRLTATDPQGLTASTEMTVYVAPLDNDAPELVGRIGNPRGNAGQQFFYRFSQSAFVDPDGDLITYTAELVGGAPLPAWLSFDAADRIFYGTPGASDIGTLEVRVMATDPYGAFATTIFTITIGGASNVAPALTGRIGNPEATAGSPFYYRFSQSAFTDADGDLLTYTAERVGGGALPGWLTFNATERTFSGTPQESDVGVYDLRVTATDPQGASASTEFMITVRSGATNQSRYALAADLVFGSEFA